MRAVLVLVLVLTLAPTARAERVLTPRATLWVDPDSSTAQVDTPDADRLAAIASATWLTGGDPYGEAARVTRAAERPGPGDRRLQHPRPRLRLLLEGRSEDRTAAYRRWMNRLARGISTRTAVVIVEPDALASGCVKTSLVKYAVTRLAKLRRTGVYIDAGHSNWQPAATMRKRLRAAAIDKADGFALNVSNYRTNRESILYAKQIGGHYVIDTSRNGQGPFTGEQDWCNPPGRGLGTRPGTTTNQPRLDAFLWVKTPGESDGECRGGPPAGQWFAASAADLIANANPPALTQDHVLADRVEQVHAREVDAQPHALARRGTHVGRHAGDEARRVVDQLLRVEHVRGQRGRRRRVEVQQHVGAEHLAQHDRHLEHVLVVLTRG